VAGVGANAAERRRIEFETAHLQVELEELVREGRTAEALVAGLAAIYERLGQLLAG